MAQAGDEIENPVTGQRLIFLKTADETGGELLEMESHYKPGGWPPALHYHPHQREHYQVIEGALTVLLDGRTLEFKSGDTFVIEPGQIHEMWNQGLEWTRVNWQVRPAMRTAELFETAFGLAADGKVNARGIPNPMQISVMVPEFDREFRLAQPPRIVQKILFGVLGPVARLMGYQGTYATNRDSRAGAIARTSISG
ncbi:MAG: cupin domain-containing protein [Thermomicrobiales bacterium]